MEPDLSALLGIVACLLGSAYFSATETALTSLSEPQTDRLIETHDSRALRLWQAHPIRVLTAILIGKTVCNVTAAALAFMVAVAWLEPAGLLEWAVPAAVAAATLLIVTVGEVAPKAVATRGDERAVRPLMWVMQLFYVLLWPVTLVFTKLTRGWMRLLGNDPNAREPYITAEEIEYMIDLGSREGTFSEDRERLLRSVFEFPDTIVREIMVPRTDVVAISADMSFDEIVDTLIACGHSRLPVYETNIDEILGLFYAKDILSILAAKSVETFDIRQFIRRPHFVPESKKIDELLSEFQQERMHLAIVVDEFGGTAGVITLEDIIEEIFGDIQDEYDVEPAQIIPLDDRTIRVDARVPVDEVEEYFDMELPEHPDYESLGGFLMTQSGSVPRPGEEVVWEGLRFRVVDADAKRVSTVVIERLDDEELEREELVS